MVDKKIQYLSNSELLKCRFRDLNLDLSRSHLMEGIAQLYFELEIAGLDFRPPCWVSDEWYVLEGVAGIAIPFYLLHPRLCRLERDLVGRAEGGGRVSFMKYLRHEAGHAIEQAYKLSNDPIRVDAFGSSQKPYPRGYQPDLSSRDYINYLGDQYAQSHPDEDFAETFAVWLDPKSRWQERYTSGTISSKLKAIDQLMKHCREIASPVAMNAAPLVITKSTKLLANHYKEKCHKYRLGSDAEIDGWLTDIFSGSLENYQPRGLGKKIGGRRRKSLNIKSVLSSSHKQRKNSQSILQSNSAIDFVHSIEGELKHKIGENLGLAGYELRELLFRVKHRIKQLDLSLKSSKPQTKAEFFDFIVDQTLEDIRRGRNKILL